MGSRTSEWSVTEGKTTVTLHIGSLDIARETEIQTEKVNRVLERAIIYFRLIFRTATTFDT